jgi:dUTPase
MEFDEVIKKLLDNEDYGNICLYSDEGEELVLEQVATIPLNDKIYVILHPVDDGIPEDAAFVFRIDLENEMITIEEDEDVADMVFQKYYELTEEDED